MSSGKKEFPIPVPVPMRSSSDVGLEGELSTDPDKNNTDNLDGDDRRTEQVVKNYRSGSPIALISSVDQEQENRTNLSKSPFKQASFEFIAGNYLYDTDSSSDFEEIIMQVIDNKAEKGASVKSPKVSSPTCRNNSESDNGVLLDPLQLIQQQQAKILTDMDDMSSSSSSSSSFSCAIIPENVSDKTLIGMDQCNINGEKTATVGNGNQTRPAGFPSIPQEILDSSIFNDSSDSDSSTFSVPCILPPGIAGLKIGFVPVPHFDFGSDDSVEGTHHRNKDSVVQRDVSEGPDPVYDEEFEPAPASESESGMNPIEDSDSTSDPEMDQQVEIPEPISLPNGDTHWQGDNDATFADEEVDMDDSDTSEPDGNPSDPSELELKDRWPCRKCKTLTNAVSRYCIKCFQIRRNWLPPRPKKSKSSPARKRIKTLFQNDEKERERHSSSSANASDEEQNILDRLKLKSISSLPRPSHTKQTEKDDIRCSSQNSSVLNATMGDINNSQRQLSHLPATSASPSTSKSMSTSGSAYIDSTDRSLLNTSLSVSLNSSPEESSQPFSQGNDSRILNLSTTQTSSQSPSSVSIAKDFTNSSGIEPCSSSQSLDNVVSDVIQSPLKLSQTGTTTKPCENHEADQNMCRMCSVREKDAAFVHSKIAHSCCCYICANRIFKSTGRCPICRGKVLSVVRIINN